MEYVACALCGSDDTQTLVVRRDLMLADADPDRQWRVCRCRCCGLTYLNPRPDASEMAQYYPSEYPEYLRGIADERSWLRRLDWRYGLRKRCKVIAARCPEGGTLLDVGCSTGSFLSEMRRFPGWYVLGVEPHPMAAAYGRERLDLDVLTGTLEDADFPDASFDVVTMWDVFEHVHDPRITLQAVQRVLRPGGLLFLHLPNLDSIDRWLFGRYWIGYELPRHLYFYGRDSLPRLLHAHGFVPEEPFCRFGSHAAFYTSMQFALRARLRSERWRRRIERALWNRPVRMLMAPLFSIVNRAGRGSEMSIFSIKPAGTGNR